LRLKLQGWMVHYMEDEIYVGMMVVSHHIIVTKRTN